MAKPPATQDTQSVPVDVATGSVDPTFLMDRRAEAQLEAGFLPYFTEDEKDELCRKGTGLYILGARWRDSDKFKDKNDPTKQRRNLELSITSDLTQPRKTGIWGGLPDTPYFRYYEPKITALLDAAEAAGATQPNIGPLYAHQRSYTNEYGTFPSYDFLATPQIDPAASSVDNGQQTLEDDSDVPF